MENKEKIKENVFIIIVVVLFVLGLVFINKCSGVRASNNEGESINKVVCIDLSTNRATHS